MRKLLLLVLAAGGSLFVLTPAAHAAPLPSGTTCGLAAVSNESPQNPGTFDGVLYAGPLVLRDDANPAIVYSGSITCTLTVNGTATYCSPTGPVTGVVAVLPPTYCGYPAFASDNVRVCTRVNLVGVGARYYNASSGTWSTSPAPCAPISAFQCDTGGTCGAAKSAVDSVLCPLLTPFFPPHGDVGVFYDCPPYAPDRTYAVLHTVTPAVVG